MLSIRIICVGRLKEKFYIDAADEFLKRLAGYCRPEIVEIPECRLPDRPSDAQVALALEKECGAIEGRILTGEMIAALCIEGRGMDSFELSKLLTDCAGSGAPKLSFVIGGSFGLHERIKNRADVRLSLSKMTFPHNLARVMLLEQIYRGFKIAEGGKYHK